ncbi:transcriptional regulator [Lachnospiraceae bacterium 54-53]
MYRVLRGEMVKKDISVAKLAEMVGISERGMRNKIGEETEFTWREVCKIQKIVNKNMSKDELFMREDQTT